MPLPLASAEASWCMAPSNLFERIAGPGSVEDGTLKTRHVIELCDDIHLVGFEICGRSASPESEI